jgi:isopenicillin N synthase-like dioxygenase
VKKQAVDFFSLPLEEKNKVAKGPGKSTGYGFATLSDKKPWSEGFFFADDPSVDDFSRTLWPQGNNPDFA